MQNDRYYNTIINIITTKLLSSKQVIIELLLILFQPDYY